MRGCLLAPSQADYALKSSESSRSWIPGTRPGCRSARTPCCLVDTACTLTEHKAIALAEGHAQAHACQADARGDGASTVTMQLHGDDAAAGCTSCSSAGKSLDTTLQLCLNSVEFEHSAIPKPTRVGTLLQQPVATAPEPAQTRARTTPDVHDAGPVLTLSMRSSHAIRNCLYSYETCVLWERTWQWFL
jgi:hypothetical protein